MSFVPLLLKSWGPSGVLSREKEMVSKSSQTLSGQVPEIINAADLTSVSYSCAPSPAVLRSHRGTGAGGTRCGRQVAL